MNSSSTRRKMGLSISELPDLIMVEILSKLPIKTILVCRCVCKNWLTITTNNPHFVALHTANTPNTFVVQLHKLRWPSPSLHMINFDSLNEIVQNLKVKVNPIAYLPEIPRFNQYTSVNYLSMYNLTNSCNGLLFLEKGQVGYQQALVCNPLTNDCILLPQSEKCKHTNELIGINSWLGYSSKSGNYKVLRMIFRSNCKVEAEVNVLGTNFWRSIEGASLHFHLYRKPYFAILNGAIHWVCRDSIMEKFIVCFDFEDEKFGEIVAPSCFGKEHLAEKYRMNVGVLGGCLYVTDPTHDYHFDIWIMKKYGDVETWSKDYKIEIGMFMDQYNDDPCRIQKRKMVSLRIYPLQILSNGEILMYDVFSLLCYDPRNKSFRSLQFNEDLFRCRAVSFAPTFVSLKHVLVDSSMEVLPLSSSGWRYDVRRTSSRINRKPTYLNDYVLD